MSDINIAQFESAQFAQQAYQQALQQMLQLAVSHHQAGRLADAEQLYQGILQGEPGQALANHNLGVLMTQRQHPEDGLPHLELALAAEPESQRYWLSYIDALALAGQNELGRQMLTFAKEHGLEGIEAEALAVVLEGPVQVSAPATPM